MCLARNRAHLQHQRSQDPKYVLYSASATVTDPVLVADVARNMGPLFTEGAIIQHLAKLRNKMDEDNTRDDLQLPVPGKIGRGVVTKPASRAYAKPIPTVSGVPKFADVSDMNEEEVAAADVRRAAKGKGKGKRTKKEMSDDDTIDDEIPTLYDSDADYGAPTTKRARKAKKTTTKQEKSVSPKTESKIDIDIESNEETPVMQTRGIRRNYAQMEYGAENVATDARKTSNATKTQAKMADNTFINADEINAAANTGRIIKSAVQVNVPAKNAEVIKSIARVNDADLARDSIERTDFNGGGQLLDDDRLDPRVSLSRLSPLLLMLTNITGGGFLHEPGECPYWTRLASIRYQRLQFRSYISAPHDEYGRLRSACSVRHVDLPGTCLRQL